MTAEAVTSQRLGLTRRSNDGAEAKSLDRETKFGLLVRGSAGRNRDINGMSDVGP